VRVVRGVVHGVGELCITLGVLLLLFVVWQLWWTDVVAGRAQDATTQRLEQLWKPQVRAAPGVPPRPAAAERPVAQVAAGMAFALIRVPRFGKEYVRPILQGTDLSTLDEGVGHYENSVGPGAVGNFALAGHRVTYAKPFNQIAELRTGDPIVIETKTSWYVYRVVRHTIVTPDRVDVVAPVPLMTMTACHPEFSARLRYVVYSQLAQTIPKTGGATPDVLTAAAS